MSENTTTTTAGDVTPSQRLKADSQALFRFTGRLWWGEARAHCASSMFWELREHCETLGVNYEDLCGPIDYEVCLDANGFELTEDGSTWVETAYREARDQWESDEPEDYSDAYAKWEASEPDTDDDAIREEWEGAEPPDDGSEYQDWVDDEPSIDDYTHTEETEPEEACSDLRLDVYDYQREVYEQWIVDDWFADRLEMVGEKCPEILGLRVWLRTTTGQSVALDCCLHSVVFSLLDGDGASAWWAKYGEGL